MHSNIIYTSDNQFDVTLSNNIKSNNTVSNCRNRDSNRAITLSATAATGIPTKQQHCQQLPQQGFHQSNNTFSNCRNRDSNKATTLSAAAATGIPGIPPKQQHYQQLPQQGFHQSNNTISNCRNRDSNKVRFRLILYMSKKGLRCTEIII